MDKTYNADAARRQAAQPPCDIITSVLRSISAAELADDDMCSVCREPPDPPVRTSCLHLYCEGCIRNTLARRAMCPYCNRALFVVSAPPRRDIRRADITWTTVEVLCKSFVLLLLTVWMECMMGQLASRAKNHSDWEGWPAVGVVYEKICLVFSVLALMGALELYVAARDAAAACHVRSTTSLCLGLFCGLLALADGPLVSSILVSYVLLTAALWPTALAVTGYRCLRYGFQHFAME
ncbi:hypothetical protein LTR65_009548 [Meristemomyces frigidus]